MNKLSFIFCFCIVLALGLVHGDAGAEKPGFFEIKNENITAKFTNWGASLVSFLFPDKTGKKTDLVLGYDTVEEYQNDKVYMGSVVGRVSNRIAGGTFKLDGKEVKLQTNDGKNTLHGGPKGFSDVVWKVDSHVPEGKKAHITFHYSSPDGDQGFPSALDCSVKYALDGNNLTVTLKAKNVGDKPTPVSMAQHAYWNFAGHNSGATILDQWLWIFGAFYVPVDEQLIPLGQITYGVGTANDFQTEPKKIGGRAHLVKTGYDNTYVIDGHDGTIKKAAVYENRENGIKMELMTNQPGLQFYDGGKLNGVKGKGGAVYNANAGLCLETQFYPDFVNHPDWPQSILKPKKVYKHYMVYKFSN
ncbi:hypothetical protein K2173_020290 [Erythroxylum novogranatense]|uniref:Aldose 1-epimerase n=1 Tax=Erythroxylum novogranatense TaxID=1862640 RepID=A0AAV8U7J4_9ROSI|nr:hypothetical protein K2173_020290 [Erythroxylum novogranatense]